MGKMPDGFIDLVVTSPPYDNLRKYKGYSFEFEEIAKELYRTIKVGGVLVWVVGDATKDGCESLTSFKQAIYFVEQCGFRLHDTMIYKKKNPMVQTHNRYEQCFEYMFVLSKGKPKTFNPLMDKTLYAGTVKNRGLEVKSGLGENGVSRLREEKTIVKEEKMRTNIFEYSVGTEPEDETGTHPAIFPVALAKEMIYSWSNEGELVYDCFGGSGTTAKAAHHQRRNWILSEISETYTAEANKMLNGKLSQTFLF
jgi:site-specific DNA-methyltransferase (adenine-specific)